MASSGPSLLEATWIATDGLIAHPHAGYGVAGDEVERCGTEQLSEGLVGSSTKGTFRRGAFRSPGDCITWESAYFMEGTARQLDLQAG